MWDRCILRTWSHQQRQDMQVNVVGQVHPQKMVTSATIGQVGKCCGTDASSEGGHSSKNNKFKQVGVVGRVRSQQVIGNYCGKIDTSTTTSTRQVNVAGRVHPQWVIDNHCGKIDTSAATSTTGR